MNSKELINQWSTMTLDEIEEQLAQEKDHEAVATLYGQDEAIVLETKAKVAGRNIDGPPVVLLPGIMGSNLNSIAGAANQLWIDFDTLIKGRANYLELDEQGEFDRVPKVEIVATGVESVTYTPLSLELNRIGDFYSFPYDWRRPIPVLAKRLHDKIEYWSKFQPKKFTLVGHSMGGLVARAYMRLFPEAEQRVEQIITLGTPYFGAVSAIENLAIGNRRMQIAIRLNAANNMKRLVRNLPSIYQLLPPPDITGWEREPANWDWWQADAYGVDGVRQDYLAHGQSFFEMLHAEALPVETIQIAGCNVKKTPIALEKQADGSFEQITSRDGDGTVPLWSAELPEATMFYVEEDHGWLPTNNKVIAAVAALIEGFEPELPTEVPPVRTGFGRIWDTVNAAAARIRNADAMGQITMRELSELYFGL